MSLSSGKLRAIGPEVVDAVKGGETALADHVRDVLQDLRGQALIDTSDHTIEIAVDLILSRSRSALRNVALVAAMVRDSDRGGPQDDRKTVPPKP